MSNILVGILSFVSSMAIAGEYFQTTNLDKGMVLTRYSLFENKISEVNPFLNEITKYFLKTAVIGEREFDCEKMKRNFYKYGLANKTTVPSLIDFVSIKNIGKLNDLNKEISEIGFHEKELQRIKVETEKEILFQDNFKNRENNSIKNALYEAIAGNDTMFELAKSLLNNDNDTSNVLVNNFYNNQFFYLSNKNKNDFVNSLNEYNKFFEDLISITDLNIRSLRDANINNMAFINSRETKSILENKVKSANEINTSLAQLSNSAYAKTNLEVSFGNDTKNDKCNYVNIFLTENVSSEQDYLLVYNFETFLAVKKGVSRGDYAKPDTCEPILGGKGECLVLKPSEFIKTFLNDNRIPISYFEKNKNISDSDLSKQAENYISYKKSTYKDIDSLIKIIERLGDVK